MMTTLRDGLHYNVPFSAYKALPGVNASSLKAMATSPVHLLHQRENEADSAALALGRAVHCAVLTPELFDCEYAVFQGARRAGKEWDAFAAVNTGREILTVKEHNQIRTMHAAVMGHATARDYLSGGVSEVTAIWGGGAYKARLDRLHVGREIFCDLKTTTDASYNAYQRACETWRLWLQMAWYREGLREILGISFLAVLIVVEKSPPYDVAVYVMDPAGVDDGEDQAHAALATLRECERTGIWPGTCPTERTMERPAWASSRAIELTFDEEGL